MAMVLTLNKVILCIFVKFFYSLYCNFNSFLCQRCKGFRVLSIEVLSIYQTTTPDIYDFVTDSKSHFHPKSPDSLPGLVEFFLQLLLPLRYQIDVRNLGYTVSLLLALFTALSLVRFLKIPILFDI